ncbi:Caffeyl-CoA reductase-Etf complex subunit CarD [subsurface metagenome]
MVSMIVCIKQVIDPEAPVSLFKIDPEAKRAIPPKGTPPVLSPFDENALEAALRIKDTEGGKITVISMGPRLAKPILRESLAVGADELILLEDEAFEVFDSYTTAYILATAIRKIGEYDLILCGRQASDTDAGQVGPVIAELLGIPSITVARRIEAGNGKVKVERLVSDGYQVIEVPMPALVTASFEVGILREASAVASVTAAKKPITIWKAEDLGVEPSAMGRSKLLELFMPEKESKCQMVEGETEEEAGANLALKLKESKII